MSDFVNSKKYLTISAFSKLSGISRKNLIYYDNIDILKPAFIKEHGYRCYTYSQLNDVSIILSLKDLNVPLKEIKNYIENISPSNLTNLFEAQKKKILEDLNKLNQMNYIIEQRVNNVPITAKIDCNEIILQNCEEELLFLGPPVHYDTNTFDDDFLSFLEYSRSEKILYGYPIGVHINYHDVISSEIGTYSYFYKICPNIDVKEKTIKPSGLYVIAYDNSYLAENMEIFHKLNEFIKKNHLNPCGNVYVENISDEMITKNPTKYLSKVSIQVKLLE